MSAPVIWFGKFIKLLTPRGIITSSRNLIESDGSKNYLPGQFQDFIVANDVATLSGATANRTTNTTIWRQSAASLIALETSVNLETSQSINITLTGTDETQFVETPLFTPDRIEVNTNIYFSFETEPTGTFAVNDIDIIAVNYNSAGTFVSRIAIQGLTVSTGFTATGGGQIPNARTTIQGFFVTTSTLTDQYSLRFRSGNAAARVLVLGQYIVGPILQPTPAKNLIGMTDGIAPTAGKLFEVITSQISSGVNAAASGTFLQLTSIPLKKGNWIIGATASVIRNGATMSTSPTWYVAISTTSAVAGTTDGYDNVYMPIGTLAAGGGISSATIVNKTAYLSADTTYYLNVQTSYAAGTPQWVGHITAIRF